VSDLSSHAQMEIAWFIPPYQFRIRGKAVVIGESGEFARVAQHLGVPPDAPEGNYMYWRRVKEEIWSGLGPMAKAYNHAPPRGSHVPPGVDNAHFNFVLVAIVPERVEVLDLLTKAYRTYVKTANGWVEEGAKPVLKERAHI
jgi:hypothetical protein